MHPSNQPPKMTAKELAKQVYPLVKQFVTDQVATHRNRPQQLQQYQQQKPIIAPGRFIKSLLQPEKPQNNHLPQDPYQQQPTMQSRERGQGREYDIRGCLKALNDGMLHSHIPILP